MKELTHDYIRKKVAFSDVIFERGKQIYEHGTFYCSDADPEKGSYVYDVDGNFGDYITRVQLLKDGINTSCNCPYPGKGCKHTVAVLLDVHDRINSWKPYLSALAATDAPEDPYLTLDEIKAQALDDRKKRAASEKLSVVWGDMFKGEHLLVTPKGRQYQVTLHDPEKGLGHCSCPDFATNRLGTCKHLIFISNEITKKKNFKKQIVNEQFPFIDIYWDSARNLPRLFYDPATPRSPELEAVLTDCFDSDGMFQKETLSDFLPLLSKLDGDKGVRVQESVLEQLDDFLSQRQLEQLAAREPFSPGLLKDFLSATLYPYQEEGVRFALHKQAALIGDEMGLGKTLQAIALAILKKQLFDFTKVIVVTMASLKEQWKREIERFTKEKAVVVAGLARQREAIYQDKESLFKITNYEAVLRDTTILSRFKPDLIILDEAQRIKNFNSKTADAIKALPRKHALVLTGTPLENKLEDVYSIVQFLDPRMLSPLWKFAADHFMLSRDKKGKIMGYRNLETLHERLKEIVIRRKKEEVLSDLPDEVVNNYYIDLTEKQLKIHNGYLSSLLPILNKKFLTPMDLRRMQELLLKMRMVCNSTYLIDRKTNISPKLNELEGILDELVVQNGRKVVIFSEWTTMTFLIAKQLSRAGICFVELSGKVPVHKRQALIDEFTNNPGCMVFLSTDAGGTGLNLQAADCVVNFELPWNPARINQRIGRVNRIGQKSKCVNVVNLISKESIEEKILTGIQLKTDLFKGVFDGGTDMVEFSREKRTELLNALRQMMGEEPALPAFEAKAQEEVPDDTPHFLNPKVLNNPDERVAYDAEESGGDASDESTGKADDAATESLAAEERPERTNILEGQSPERVEMVLNSGMQFISNLLEMATGKKMEAVEADQRMVNIDRSTGEVTLKFRLPGF